MFLKIEAQAFKVGDFHNIFSRRLLRLVFLSKFFLLKKIYFLPRVSFDEMPLNLYCGLLLKNEFRN